MYRLQGLNTPIYLHLLSSVDGFGNEVFDAPIEVMGRYESKRVLFIGVDGKEQPSKAIIYLAYDASWFTNDYEYLGKVSLTVDGVAEHIKGVSLSPVLRGSFKLVKVFI